MAESLKVDNALFVEVQNDLIDLQAAIFINESYGAVVEEDQYQAAVRAEKVEKSIKEKIEQNIKENSQYATEIQKQLKDYGITVDYFSQETRNVLEKNQGMVKEQSESSTTKSAERPAYTVEFKYDESAKQRRAQESTVVAGRFYSVKVNGMPVQEAMKNDPNVAKVLEYAAKNNPDLKVKNITAENLKSGHILGLQTNNVGSGKFDKPETLKLNDAGQQIASPKAQTEKSVGKEKSSDISL